MNSSRFNSPPSAPPSSSESHEAGSEAWLRLAPRGEVVAYVLKLQQEVHTLRARLAADNRNVPPPKSPRPRSSTAASPVLSGSGAGTPNPQEPTSPNRSPSPTLAQRRKVPTPVLPASVITNANTGSSSTDSGLGAPSSATASNSSTPTPPTSAASELQRRQQLQPDHDLPPPPPEVSHPVIVIPRLAGHGGRGSVGSVATSGTDTDCDDLPPPPPQLTGGAAHSAPTSPALVRPAPKAHRPSSLGPTSITVSSEAPPSPTSSPASPSRRGPPPAPRPNHKPLRESKLSTSTMIDSPLPTGSISSLASTVSSNTSSQASSGPRSATLTTAAASIAAAAHIAEEAAQVSSALARRGSSRRGSARRSSGRRLSRNSSRRSFRRTGSVRSVGSAEGADLQGNYELSSDLEAVLAQSVGQRYAHPKYEKAARIIQRHWRSHMLRKRFRQVKKRALRRSMQKKIDRLCAGAKHVSPDPSSTANRMSRLQALKNQASSRGGTPTPPVSSDFAWMPEHNDAKTPEERARLNRIGVYQFNRNIKKGMDWLFANKVVHRDPQSMAAFLRGERTLNRRRIGELLGESMVPFNMEVLEAYVASFNFAGVTFAQALRRFLTTFHLPGEAQKIERIVEAFAAQYHSCNAGVFAHQDTPFVLAFSVVMLNTDVHNPANKHKMTKEEFVRNNRGIDGDGDLPREMLEAIYEDIANEEFKTVSDNSSMIENIANQINTNKNALNLAASHRQFVSQCNVTTVEDFGKAKSKQTCKSRTLFLFNDLLVVTKANKGRYNLKQVIPLLGVAVRAVLTDFFDNGFELINNYDGGTEILLFRIDNLDKSTMAKNFERDLREMVWQCEVIEGARFKELTLTGPEDTDARSIASSHSDLRGGSRRMTISSGKSRASSDSGDVPLEHERRFSLSMKFGVSLRRKKRSQESTMNRVSTLMNQGIAESPLPKSESEL